MGVTSRSRSLLKAMAITAVLLLPAMPAMADEFFLYLKCSGNIIAGGKSQPADVDLALRDNNETALIQQSNVLPVGERLKYKVSPSTYSMRYYVPGTRTGVIYDWWHSQIFIWYPSLQQLSMVRLSINRQSGQLTGVLENSAAESLASLKMNCEAEDEEDLPEPKF